MAESDEGVTRICPHCEATMPGVAKFCAKCGNDMNDPPSGEDEVGDGQGEHGFQCPHCGSEQDPSIKFCGKCGQAIATDDVDETDRAAELEEAVDVGAASESAVELDKHDEPDPEVGGISPEVPTELPEGHAACPHCGHVQDETAKFCARCGTSTAAERPQPEPWDEPEAGAAPDTRRRRAPSGISRSLLIGGAITALVVLVVLFLMVFRPSGATGSDRLLIGELDRDGNADVHVIRAGDELSRETELASNVSTHSSFSMEYERGYFRPARGQLLSVGGDDLVLTLNEDGDEALLSVVRGDGLEEVESFRDPSSVSVRLADDGGLRVAATETDGTQRCFAGDAAGLDRVLRGDKCDWNHSGNLAASVRQDADGAQVSVATAGGDELELLDDEVEVLEVLMAGNGEYVAITYRELNGSTGDSDVTVEVFNVESGESIHRRSEPAAGLTSEQLFFPGGNIATTAVEHGSRFLIGYASPDDDEEELVLFDPLVGEVVIERLRGDQFQALTFDRTGRYVIYLIRDENDPIYTLLSYDVTTAETVEIADADDYLSFTLLEVNALVVVTGDRDVLVASASGESVEDIGRVEDDPSQARAFSATGGSGVWVWMAETQRFSIYGIDSSSLVEGLAEWAVIDDLLALPDQAVLLVEAREDSDDDPILMVLDLIAGEVTELDDRAEGYSDFAMVGDRLIYSARVGSDADEWEVRSVRLDGEERPETLYRDARLLGGGRPLSSPIPWLGSYFGSS